jgi:hypothetical protein
MTVQKMRLTYHDVVASLPALNPEEQLTLLEVLSAVIKKTVQKKERRHSLLELEGLGADLWTKVSVDNYIRQERDSWN